MTNVRPRRLPLYLVEDHPAEIAADGPALAVNREGRATMRYPVARLQHVVTRDDHHWHPGALQLCMAHRLSLLFVDSDGLFRGALRPGEPRPDPTGEAVARLAWEAGESWRLENWVHAERLNALVNVDDGVWSRDLDRLARTEGPLSGPMGPAERQVGIALRSVVESRLRAAGFLAYYPVRGGGWWDLGGELTDILRLAWLAETGLLSRNARMPTSVRLEWMHKRLIRYERVAALALDRLERLAREVDAPCP